MHDLMLFFAAMAFGALAWAMLVVSDWLLGDKEPSQARRGKSTAVRHHNKPVDLACHY
jgi:purine-nucleoside phosphorylase